MICVPEVAFRQELFENVSFYLKEGHTQKYKILRVQRCQTL